MTGGLPSYRQSTFANSKPPTLFSPASPKMAPSKPEKEVDVDNASMMSTSTYRSSMSLLKSKLNSKKESKAHKKEKKELPKDPMSRKLSPPDWNARARTAEAYMVQALFR